MMQRIKTGRLRLPRYWEAPLFVTATFLIFVVARYMQWGARREIFKTLRIEFVFGLVLAVACAFLISASPVKFGTLKTARNVLIGIALLFAVMIIQIPFAADKELANSIFIDRVIKFAMLTFFMVVLIRSPRAMRLFMGAFLFACFYVTQESTRGLISGGLVWQNQGVMRLHGAVPIYAHPNSLAGVAMGTLPFCFFLFPAIKRWLYRLPLLPLVGTASTCVLFSGSRTGYVAFAVLILFWWSQTRKKFRSAVIAVLLISLAIPLLPEQYVERFKSIGGQEAEGHSKEKRIEILQDATAIFLANPGGVGIASFPAVRMRKFGRKQDTHNLYLEVATNLGVQGVVVFVFLLVSLMRAYRSAQRSFEAQMRALARAARKRKPPGKLRRECESWSSDLRFMRGVSIAASGFIVIRLALGMFGMDLYEPYWWFGAGLAFNLVYIAKEMRRGSRYLVSQLEAVTPE